jgi:hypothetical protein
MAAFLLCPLLCACIEGKGQGEGEKRGRREVKKFFNISGLYN